MKLNYGVKYSKVLKKYSDEIIFDLCEGKDIGDIATDLTDKYNVNIPFQAVTWFYHNNKKYIDECIKNRQNEKKEELKEQIGLDWLKERAYTIFKDLGISSSELKKLPIEQRLKYGIQLVNAIAKLEDKDKSEINLNQMDLSSIFSDDLNWEG